ncbi:MAG: alpha-L-fucosidase [Terriglobales bacterium]
MHNVVRTNLIMRAIFLFLLLCTTGFGQTSYQPTAANLAAREWFQNAKFGMFIHWGVYSVLGSGEWVMEQRPLTFAQYEKLPAQFNPQKFNAAAWVALAKSAGMKYITITSRHHDGFSMFDTKATDYNIVQQTPYGRDPLKQLADECHRQGIKLFFYYSQLDWHNPDYFPRGATGHHTGRPENGDWNRYLDFMNAQLRELLTNYGEIGGIWFDGMWDKPGADWKLDRTYGLIHQLQPAALIIPNHHKKPFSGEDVQTFEKDLPGVNTTGFGGAPVSQLPLETSETMNQSWGFNIGDSNYKSTRELIRYLVRAAGNNANFLLNVGPMPNGEIQPEFVERLKEMGTWVGKYGDSIYGTRGGPVPPAVWGVTTQKGNRVYVHVLDWTGPSLALPALKKVKSAKMLDGGAPVQFREDAYGLQLKVPPSGENDIDRVVVLETAN